MYSTIPLNFVLISGQDLNVSIGKIKNGNTVNCIVLYGMDNKNKKVVETLIE